MHLAISTHSLSDNTTDALARAAALGFRHVEINLLPAEFGYGYRRQTNARFYRELRQRLEDLSLQVWSTTTPALTAEQLFSQQARRDIFLSSAIAAGVLGSRVIIVRLSDILRSENEAMAYFQDNLAPPVIDGFDEAWVQAVNRRVSMAIRNEEYWYGLPLINQVERVARVTSDLAIGWAFDLRQSSRRAPPTAWLAPLSERLALAYAYDLEAGRPCAPRAAEWSTWLPPLGQSRLKCLVLVANPDQTDAEIVASRDYLSRLLGDG